MQPWGGERLHICSGRMWCAQINGKCQDSRKYVMIRKGSPGVRRGTLESKEASCIQWQHVVCNEHCHVPGYVNVSADVRRGNPVADEAEIQGTVGCAAAEFFAEKESLSRIEQIQGAVAIADHTLLLQLQLPPTPLSWSWSQFFCWQCCCYHFQGLGLGFTGSVQMLQ